MAVQKLTIQEFVQLAKASPVLDVRSPGEYLHAHIPGAYSLPLFTDEERKVVGTAYKQQNRKTAIKMGLDYFGVKMRSMVEAVETLINDRNSLTAKRMDAINGQQTTDNVLVHCWRGGMRSAGVAWLLDLYGFKVYTLAGGYKAYRKWVREQFEIPCDLKILGGYTGSGKTLVLQQLQQAGLPVIDLEKIACHKGSAFGGMDDKPQPGQEMFENLLALSLSEQALVPGGSVWLEDESQRIGNVKIPDQFWKKMRSSELFFLNIPFEERLQYITQEYGVLETEKLQQAITRIQKRLGGLETKNALGFLTEQNHLECFRILLKYYDKWYSKGLYNRHAVNELLKEVPFSTIDVESITASLIQKNKRSIDEALQTK